MTQSSLWQPSDIMSAEAGTEPEAPKRRGRIPQSAWPHILERHRAGATLSAIAREFDCTPSAISYIVRKAEASGIEPALAPEAEPAESSQTVTDSVAESAEPTAQPETVQSETVQSETAQQEQPEAVPSDTSTAVASAAEGVASGQSVGETPAVERPVVERPVVEQAPEPRPVVKRSAPSEGRQQLRASDLGRAAAQPTVRPPEPAPAAAPVEARPAATAPASAEAVRPVTAPTGRQEPAPPVDAVEGRLRDTARSCLVAYRGWKSAPGENSIQTLHDAVHELRKALARIEIDMSASRRDEQVNRPIPIPAHRAARRPR